MTDRADAHIHLFEGGYRGGLTGRPGVRIDEAALYDDLAREYGIRRALIVGYADAPWCTSNNSWIAERAAEYPWARPLAFVDPCTPPDALMLERLAGLGFVGLSMYIASAARTRALAEIPDVLWGSLAERGWLVSVNSQPARWRAWQPVLARHATLRLLASHLGQAPPTAEPPSRDVASAALAPLLELAAWPGPRVKLSGFYAISDPASARLSAPCRLALCRGAAGGFRAGATALGLGLQPVPGERVLSAGSGSARRPAVPEPGGAASHWWREPLDPARGDPLSSMRPPFSRVAARPHAEILAHQTAGIV